MTSNQQTIGFRLSQQQDWLLYLREQTGCELQSLRGRLRLDGPLDPGRLQESLCRVVWRHEVLRTRIESLPGTTQPIQVIGEATTVAKLRDFSHVAPEGRDPALADIESEPRYQDLRGDALYAELVRFSADLHYLMIAVSPLCCDCVSLQNMVRELAAGYEVETAEVALALEPLQYADYAAWQEDVLASDEGDGARYWRRNKRPNYSSTRLALETPTGDTTLFDPAAVELDLSQQQVSALNDLSACHRAANATILLAAWAILLHRHAGQPEIELCFFSDGRSEPIVTAIGTFVLPLPLHCRFEPNETFAALLQRAHATLEEHRDWQDYALANNARGSGTSALRLGFEYTAILPPVRAGSVLMTLEATPAATVEPFRLHLQCLAAQDRLKIKFHYDRACFSSAAVDCLAEQWSTLLADALRAPGTPIKRLALLSAAERERLMRNHQRMASSVALDRSGLHALLDRQAKRVPQALALRHGEVTWTYAELHRRANFLAVRLMAEGLRSEDRVGLLIQNPMRMVAAIFAVLKAGGAYVPLDPTHPVDRLSYVLEDAAVTLLLSERSCASIVDAYQFPSYFLDDWLDDACDGERHGGPIAKQLPDTDPNQLAYLIYTSGSTGQPKGVAISHGAALHSTLRRHLHYPAQVRGFLLLSSFSFDSSVAGLFWTLGQGGCLCLPTAEELQDPAALAGLIERHELSHLLCIPSLYVVMLDQDCVRLRSLQAAIVAGESCPSSLPLLHHQRLRHARLYNEYGPTEAAVWSTFVELAPQPGNQLVTIGWPIEGTRIVLFDEQQELAPRGVAGELYIGGAGLARGYLGRPGLTAERFVPDPFGGAGERLYRTGDLARYRPDGNIEFLGRIDHQVKIRGFRIELGEIETAICRVPGVREAVVLAREDSPGEKRLVAYVVGQAGTEPAAGDLRAALQLHLPDYMVPSAFVMLDALPRTTNGKVDRKALPSPNISAQLAHQYVAPRTPTEAALCRIWAEVLGLDRVGIEDNFFELGGHSLLAMTLIERMRRQGLQTGVRALFANPTPAGLAAAVGSDAEVLVPPNLIPEGCEAITPEMLPLVELTQPDIDRIVGGVPGGAFNVQDIYPLTPLQQGMFFHHLMAVAGDPYLTSTLLAFDTRARFEGFLGALQAVIARHDILRMAVVWEGLPEPVQVVWREAPLIAEEVSFNPAAGDIAEQLRARFDPRQYQCRLDLRQAPLMRGFAAHDAAKERWLLQLFYHHMIDDNTSLRFFLTEAQAHLLGEEDRLPAPLPFRNFVAQARLGVNPAEHEAFFRAMLGGVTEPTAPFGLMDVQGDGSGIEEARLDLDAALARRLRARARALGVSAASLCHQAFAQLLARVSGRADVVFGTVLFGRMHGAEGADRALGIFINTLPVRAQAGAESVANSVRHMHEQLVALLRHEHASLVLAQRCSSVAAPAPLFSALLNYRHSPAQGGASGQTALAWDGIDVLHAEERTNYPLTLSVDDLGEGFQLTAQVQRPLDPDRVCAFMRVALERLVETLETAPETATRTIDVLPEAERRQMLVEWNDTAVDYPRDRLLHELFEEQVGRAPEAVAVVFEDTHLTYAELNGRANRLAHHLRERGVGPDVIVGICVERSLEMMVGLLGILKAGGAYLPLDPDYPRERLAYMLADAAPVLVLTQEALRERLPETSAALCLDKDWPSIGGASQSNPAPRATPQNLAYVIYTSGSTGTPKGVAVTHQNVRRLFAATEAEYGFTAADVWTLFHSYAFDFSVWEIWGALLYGGRLIIVPYWVSRSPEIFYKFLEKHSVTVLNQTPSSFYQLDAFDAAQGEARHSSLRLVIFGGEALELRRLAGWFARYDDDCPQLVNMYGITETTVHVTLRHLKRDDAHGSPDSAIGRPLDDLQAYLLDAHLCPVPIGVSGELYIGGAGLARGYLGRPDLTAERFVPDPFGGAGERLYRTGDLARYRPDGNIEFLGRIDHQVKIRGFRIELGEIETAICRVPGVREAVVLAREDSPGEKRLVAYVAPDTARLKAARRDEDAGEGDERVGKWETLFDETYGADDIGNGPSFVGWNSSYTGAPILEAEMQEWLQCTISRIGSLQPERLLEIGCGVGLLLQHLAPACRVYRGTDISGLAITRLRRWLETQERFRHVELVKGHAAEIVNIEAGSFDTVVLNSVVQYFPNVEYLLGVLEGAVNLVSPGGRVFVGDVRHLGLLPVFHSSVQLDQAPAGLSIDQLKNRIDGAVEREKELVIDPDFFLALQEHLPRIGAVEILLKRGRSNNELTRYRYDVALHVGNLIASVPQQSFEWKEGENSFAEFAARLSEQHPSAVSIGGVPNRRLARDLAAVRLLGTVGRSSGTEGLRDDLDSGESVGEDPEAFWALGERLGYEVRISWTSDLSEGQFDVLFVDPAELANGKAPTYHRPVTMLRPWSAYANDPLAATLRQRLGSELREILQTQLPEYMVPSAFVMLEALPLTANGKVDRKALPSPDIGAQLAHQYVAPRTPTEAALCRIWAEVLGLDRVGIEDNFFELGGHSLLAMTLIERMRRQGLQTDVRALFASPTPAGLAAAMRSGPLVVVPPNLIPSGCDTITSEMLPLVELSQADIDRIAGGVPGGASNVQDIYPLAPLQEGILFHHLIAAKGDPYLASALLAFDTRARFEGFLGALRAVIARHDILRTAVVWEGLPEPVQVVWREAPLSVEEVSLDPAAGDIAEQLRARFDARQYRLDVRRAPLLHGFLACDAAKERWLLLLLVHHLALDHTTLEILVEEAQAHLLGEEDRLPAPLPFRNFVAQARLGVSEAEHEAFFRAMLGGVTEPTAPFGLMDVQGDGSGIEEARLDLDAALARRLRARARALGVSAASLCHQAFAQLLARVSGRADVVFGTVLFGRMHGAEGADRALGIFINTLPVRAQAGAESVANSVRHMHEQLVALLRHEHASLVLAQRCSSVAAPAPLFSALLNYRHSPAQGGASGQTALAWDGIDVLHGEERTNYPLTLSVDDLGEGFQLTAQVQRPLDPDRVCAFMRVALERLVETLETAPETATRTIDVLPEAERRQMLVEWNDTAVDYPRDRLLHELFEEQVGRAPEAVAVVFEDTHLTYAELNGRANRLAHHLRERGVGPDVIVGICVERSLEMMVGLLGILKAGGAYLPLDPDYPRERLAYMLADAAPVLVLTQEALRERLPETSAALCLDKDWPSIGGASQSNPAPRATPQNLAYVIYTSGSTGTPKGVAVTHQNVRRLFAATEAEYGFTAADVWTLFHSYAFDFSVWEIWGALLYGGRLIIVPYWVSRSPEIFYKFLEKHSVTVLNQTPSSFYQLDAFDAAQGEARHSSLRLVIFGGEALELRRLAGWFARYDDDCPQLVNMYGITETTVHVTLRHLKRDDAHGSPDSAIGRPLDDLQAYLLDAHLCPVPIGVSGELYIGGAGLARGYLGRPDLTAERFVPDPFGGAGERLYRTGDLARYRPDGNIEFLGRIDHQVKIRGFRIELGEIETAICRVPGVREAVVLAREDSPGEKRLVAYVVGQAGTEPAAGDLRAALQLHLPDYMVPSAFVMLDALPRTTNGKVDRKALPSPDISAQLAHRYVAPRTPTEAALCRIWTDVLGLDRVGIEDNFFELGGHSLLAVQVISRIRREFERELALRSLFASPTIAEFAKAMGAAGAEAGDTAFPEIEPAVRVGALPLSFAQQRLWFLDQLTPWDTSYNIPAALRLLGCLDVAAFTSAVNEIVRRHDVLRTTFVGQDGVAAQVIAPVLEIAVPVVDLSGLDPAPREMEVRRLVGEEAQRPFDLAVGPLLRVMLLDLGLRPVMGEHEQIVVFTLHHIVSDGWSTDVLIREFVALYEAFVARRPSPLPDLSIQYADYAVWQRDWLQGEVLDRQLAYWRDRLAGAPPLLDLPTDHPRPAVQDHAGAAYSFVVTKSVAERLVSLGRQEGATLFMVLLAGFQLLLSRYSGQTDICVGTPIANRRRLELEGLIGFFVNTLVLRTDLSGDPNFRGLLARVREMALGAQAHQDLPFERLVEALQPVRDMSRDPLFQVLFVLQNAPMRELALGGLRAEPVMMESGTAKFDLALVVIETGEGLSASIEYATALFDARTIERLARHYCALLEAIVADPETRISRLPMLSAAERRQMLVEWNDTAVDYPRDRLLHELFEEQVGRAPEAIAVVFEDTHLTYGELNGRANRLAHHLRERGVGPDVIVGICVERSLDMMVGLLGILKAGGAYLPLDPDYPRERLAYMLADAAPVLVLTQEALRERLPETSAALCLDKDWPSIGGASQSNPTPRATPQNLAYVIYTSGSTGRPKGVAIAHRGVVNLTLAQANVFKLNTKDRVLQLGSISFDLATEEIFPTLVSGATLVLCPERVRDSWPEFVNFAAGAGLTFFNLTTAFWHHLTAWLAEASAAPPECLRLVCVGGEKASTECSRLWRMLVTNRVAWINSYGPTEATVTATIFEMEGESNESFDLLPIGRPIWNTQIYLLDDHLLPVPIGVAGELYIGGAGLARGYLGRPDLTAERFVPDPFGGAGERLYRTGDLACYRPDGNIEFLGRIDHQVKIRGFRIELGEIEAALARVPGVREAVVLAREDSPGEKRLVAYVVGSDGTEPAAAALRMALQRDLPDHMVPSAFVMLEALPLTANGKIDRKALPSPDIGAQLAHQYVAPRTPTEAALCRIWTEVLGLDRVGIEDNFFELGGHSLLAVTLIERMRRQGLQTDVRTLFANPTPAGLAAVIGISGEVAVPANLIPEGCEAITPEMLLW